MRRSIIIKNNLSNLGQSGFALPIAVGVGLVMILVATTMVVRSTQTQETSVMQRSTTESLAAAETGVAQIMSVLNQYREFASVSTSETDSGWSDLRTIIKSRDSSCFSDGDSALSPLISRAWQSIIDPNITDPVKRIKGRYRLVSYTFDGTNRQGTLLVQGESATRGAGEGLSQISVTIPVQPSFTPGPSPSDGSIAANQCRYLPLPSPPPTDYTLDSDDLPSVLPRVSDVPNASGSFVYKLDAGADLAMPTLIDTLTIAPNRNVVFVVDGNITIEGNAKIKIEEDSNLAIFAGKNVTINQTVADHLLIEGDGRPESFQILLSGVDSGIGNDTGKLLLTTIVDSDPIRMIVYAPDASVSLMGKSPPTPVPPPPPPPATLQFRGVVWAKKFTMTNTDYFAYTPNGLDLFSPWGSDRSVNRFYNQLQPISSWKRQQVIPESE